MRTVRIYGAGSIGNHLAFACRTKGWQVELCDSDGDALERTKTQIYPLRYGEWDKEIHLTLLENLEEEKKDLVIIGTPPDTHMKIAIGILKKTPPKCMLIEKPLAIPSLEGCQELVDLAKKVGTFVGVGYNHTLTGNTQIAENLLNADGLGDLLTISAQFREYWGGIFDAHPWLTGPKDSYLGFSSRGGGACGEHSHAINIWQHFSHICGAGRIVEVSSVMETIDDGTLKYDKICRLSVKTESGLSGSIVQDVLTQPPLKYLRIQGSSGYLEWHVNYNDGHDAVFYQSKNNLLKKELVKKERVDDFKGEIDHIEEILDGRVSLSPISVERGMDTMLVIGAAYLSNRTQKTIRINYWEGYSYNAYEIREG